jgi:hypothetical protein
MYKKPSSVGRKASLQSKRRRAELPEPQLFVDRVADGTPVAKKTCVSPLRLKNVGGSSNWQVHSFHKTLYTCELLQEWTKLMIIFSQNHKMLTHTIYKSDFQNIKN